MFLRENVIFLNCIYEFEAELLEQQNRGYIWQKPKTSIRKKNLELEVLRFKLLCCIRI